MDMCTKLAAGNPIPAYNSTGGLVYTHELHTPHPCKSFRWSCWPSVGSPPSLCTWSGNAACHAGCDALNLLDVYQYPCHESCNYTCPTTVQ
jgi:hypothetical protein